MPLAIRISFASLYANKPRFQTGRVCRGSTGCQTPLKTGPGHRCYQVAADDDDGSKFLHLIFSTSKRRMDSTSSPERTSQDGNGHHQPPSPRSPCDDSESNGLSNGHRIQTQRAEHGPVAQPERQNTSSSTATVATTIATQASAETATSTYSLETASDKLVSSQPSSQPRYSATNGIDVTSPRRPSSTRRRQGPLTAEQRRKASVIRRLGACPSCKKRRVAVSAGSSSSTITAPLADALPFV